MMYEYYLLQHIINNFCGEKSIYFQTLMFKGSVRRLTLNLIPTFAPTICYCSP